MAQGVEAWFARQSIELVNRERERAGLPRLEEHLVLTEVAKSYSEAMARRGFYGHVSPEGEDVADRVEAAGYLAVATAENLARGQGTPADVVAGWMSSPGHRDNILNPDLRAIGAGYATTPDDIYHHYWTHVFAAPDPSAGRDRNRYPAEVVAEVNQARRRAGRSELARSPVLETLAQNHLRTLVRASAENFGTQAQRTLEAVTQAAAQQFGRTAAQVGAGNATPEAVVEDWLQGQGRSQLLDPAYTEAGAAYHFAPEDDTYRHYWLLLLAGPR